MKTPVTFEISQLLKEKGFSDPCHHYYYKGILDSSSKDNWNALNGYSAPTIAEVVMWIYEKRGIWVTATPQDHSKTWEFTLFNVEPKKRCISPSFNSLTEAYEAGFKYILNNLT